MSSIEFENKLLKSSDPLISILCLSTISIVKGLRVSNIATSIPGHSRQLLELNLLDSRSYRNFRPPLKVILPTMAHVASVESAVVTRANR
jgi:hypothetical protein